MTLATIRNKAKLKLRITSTATDGLLPDATLTGLVNEAIRKFSREREWPWLLTSATVSVATTGLGTLPSDYLMAHSLVYDDRPVQYVGLSELLGGQFRYAWTDTGTQIRVEPAPAASTNFTLHYYQREEELSADGDLPLLPTAHEDVPALWAAHLGAVIRKDYEHAAVLANEYDREVRSLADDVFRKRGGGIRVQRRGEKATLPARWS